MNLRDVSDLAQVVGNVAVIVTLIVLIVQIRANTRALDRQMRVNRARALWEDHLASPDLLRALVKINATAMLGTVSLHVDLAERFGLTPEQGWLVFATQAKMWSMYEAEFMAGAASSSLERSTGAIQTGPHHRISWQQRRFSRDPVFARYLDTIAER